MKQNPKTISITAKLINLSKSKGAPYGQVLTNFLIERLLVRLTSSTDLKSSLVFKGGFVCFRVFESTRHTTDLDAVLLGSRENIEEKIQAAIKAEIHDGVWFTFINSAPIKGRQSVDGITFRFKAGLGDHQSNSNAQNVDLDIGFGNSIFPDATEQKLQALLGDEEISWHVYPLESIVAEKLHAIYQHGDINSRSKDIYDLCFLLPKLQIGTNINEALRRTFATYGSVIPQSLYEFLKKLDVSRLKAGWQSAVVGIPDAPEFMEALNKTIEHLKKLRL